MRNETGPKELVRIFILENIQVVKTRKHQSETSEPEDSEKSNWSERLGR